MNINILQNKLKDGLMVVGRAVAKSSTLPILKNIHLKAEENHLCLTATDLEIGLKYWSLVDVKKKGDVLVNFESFNSFINFLPKEKVNLENDNNNIKIICKDYKTKINGIDSGDFPIIPIVNEKRKIKLKSDVLCDSLITIVDIPSDSKIKPEISGILFSFKDGDLNFVATDTYRLAEKKNIIKEKINDFSFILPQRTVKEVINIFKDINKDVEVILDENQIVFRTLIDNSKKPQIELTSKIIEGNYPDYKKIIPQETSSQVILKREEFLNKIKAASVFSTKVKEVSLEISPKNGLVNIKSNNTDIGSYESEIKGRGEGIDIIISFNYKFLIDGLNSISSSEIIFEVSEDNKPGLIKPVGKSDYIYVIMPIKK